MLALNLISQLIPDFSAANAKVHLASFNGVDAPIDVYLAGNFPEWQRYQSAKNFEREYVVALVELPQPNMWLFAGLWKSVASAPQKTRGYYYTLTEVPECVELNGRLIIEFQRPGRTSYLKAERWADRMHLNEIRQAPLNIREFPGYRNINLSFGELQHVVKQAAPTWCSALSSIAGVYLISDTKLGKLYVGSASGEGGIWRRWTEYARNGHGGNKELRRLTNTDPEHVKHWRLSILELADVTASDESVLQRESHWKQVLLSRTHGLNAN
jgi:hypothetical protein